MIRAVVQNGIIHPLDPLPREWSDGQEVVVTDAPRELDDREAPDNWLEEMAALTAELNDPQEWEQIEAALAEADRQSKAVVRREMGLP
jgi:hypothetical protein